MQHYCWRTYLQAPGRPVLILQRDSRECAYCAVCAHLFVPGYPGPLKELQASSNPVKASISEVVATLKGFVQTGLSAIQGSFLEQLRGQDRYDRSLRPKRRECRPQGVHRGLSRAPRGRYGMLVSFSSLVTFLVSRVMLSPLNVLLSPCGQSTTPVRERSRACISITAHSRRSTRPSRGRARA